MPGTKWKRSLRNPRQYEALKNKRGMSKRKAARISNAGRKASRRGGKRSR